MSQSAQRGLQIHETTEHGVTAKVHSKKEIYLNCIFAFVCSVAISIVLLSPFILPNMATAVISAFALGVSVAFFLGSCIGKLSKEKSRISGLKYAFTALLGAIISHLVADLPTVV